LISTCKQDKSTNPGGVSGFEGVYRVRENCTVNGYSGYTIKIQASGGTNQVYIYNFFNIGTSKYIYAEVDGMLLHIQPQTFSGFTVYGSGNVSGSNLTIEYKIDDGVTLDSCHTNCSRQ